MLRGFLLKRKEVAQPRPCDDDELLPSSMHDEWQKRLNIQYWAEIVPDLWQNLPLEIIETEILLPLRLSGPHGFCLVRKLNNHWNKLETDLPILYRVPFRPTSKDEVTSFCKTVFSDQSPVWMWFKNITIAPQLNKILKNMTELCGRCSVGAVRDRLFRNNEKVSSFLPKSALVPLSFCDVLSLSQGHAPSISSNHVLLITNFPASQSSEMIHTHLEAGAPKLAQQGIRFWPPRGSGVMIPKRTDMFRFFADGALTEETHLLFHNNDSAMMGGEAWRDYSSYFFAPCNNAE